MKSRLIALTAVWSWDHWMDVTHNTKELRAADTGPDEYEHVLVREFDGAPSADEIEAALDELRVSLTQVDGRAELSSHAVLDDAAWQGFLSPPGRAAEIVDAAVPFALIHHHRSLRSALEVGASAGVPFVEDDGAP